MKESVVKRFSVGMLVLVVALSITLAGCSSPSSPSSGSSGSENDNSTTPPVTQDSADEKAAETTTPAAGGVSEEVQGMWFSKSEILPPEQETDQYSLEIAADGSFVLKDGDSELYTGTLKITDTPETGWGEAVIDGETIATQLVNAQGVYKLILNASAEGEDWNKDFKKIVFMR
jgi:hypothetical protein